MARSQPNAFLVTCGLVLVLAGVRAGAHREHKVHNIVLYPDKHSWCRTTTIKQVISYPGCRSVEIDNNVCVGACFSYSIPHTEPSDPGEVIVPYCDSCQPSETTWSDVTLDCSPAAPSTSDSSHSVTAGAAPAAASSSASAASSSATAPPTLVKRVQIITNCSCAPCERSIAGLASDAPQSQPLAAAGPQHRSSSSAPTVVAGGEHSLLSPTSGSGADESSVSYDIPLNDGPDLLNVLQLRNSTLQQANGGGDGGAAGTHAAAPEHLRQLMNNKIVSLLQRIQETNQPQDKQQLKELLQMIQDPEDGQPGHTDGNDAASAAAGVTPLTWSDAAFAEFVERLDDEHVELDVARLREVLHKFERSQAYKEYRRREQELEEQRLRDQHQQLLDKHHHDKALHHLERQLQNQPTHHQASAPADTRSMADNFTNRTDAHQTVTSEHEASSTPSPTAVDTPTVDSTSHHGHANHHHHVVGEHVAAVGGGSGRLTKGPHGALVIEPDVVVGVQHEQLDVSPTELKANHAGTMLSYGGAPPPSAVLIDGGGVGPSMDVSLPSDPDADGP